MNTLIPGTLIALALTLAACSKAPAPTPQPEKPKAAPVIIKGAVVQATERAFPRFLRVTGQLTGQNDAVVAADSMGRVVSALIERGSVVKAGDVLAKLDERQPKLSLAEAAASVNLAKARLALAKNEQERNKPLAEKKAVKE